ncbi:MAG: single-stranded-DNA-specific exonuclease RecJ [Rickettsiales bacterium]|jgi:single-stranded-DNA-specific exonuclease|nr:single-stranded-DNA-specific exonuclease RecJ [Rickettsiales bacterium]
MRHAISPDDRVIESSNYPASATGAIWQFSQAPEHLLQQMMQAHELPEILARILVSRGIAVEAAHDFLNPSLKTSLPDPSHLKDMDIAAERVAAAVLAGETIAIWGDYDVDGATSSALLARYLRALGLNPLVYIPDRMKEGYGPNSAGLLSLKEQGASLVITVDCGTLSFAPLEAAHEAGLNVVVVDHHQGEARKPKCLALVNPNRLDENSPHKHLAAVGVAFLLCVAVNRKLRESPVASRQLPDLISMLDIVALGTVADVVPLVGANRAMVAQGLKVMAAKHNIGIRTLLETGRADGQLSAYHCGFILGPRINAGGRVGKSDLGVRILTTEDEEEARRLAAELEQYNAERKAIEAGVLEEAMTLAERAPSDAPILLLAGQGWHPGVIGIVAGRVKERFNVPCAVIGIEGGVGKASARSVTGVDLGAAVIAALEAGYLVAGGGHAMAAGFTVKEETIPELEQFLSDHIRRQVGDVSRNRHYRIDANVAVGGANVELIQALKQLEPFGQGNPSVRLMVEHAVNLKPEIVGEAHVRTLLIDRLSNARLNAIAFRAVGTKLGDSLLSSRGKEIRLIGHLKENHWNGSVTAQLMIEDVALA